jgi:hypothetical protein
MGITVRQAQHTDIDWIVHQLRKFSEFYGTKLSLFGDDAYARERLTWIIDCHVFLVADHSQHGPVGFIAGLAQPHFFNPSIRHLAELFWWVDEAHRGGKAGLLLLRAFTDWGRENCDWITCSLEHHSPVKDETLTRRGFKIQERSFLLEV